ncbi:hypothetical protein P4V34_28735 [Bacillus thuringiensis]|nr:hypothetical protein [Bacillus thuringiensis]
MKPDLCGVCNEEIPIGHVCISRREGETGYKFTSYHIACENKIPKKPCDDCGKHRLLCNECKE